MHDNAIIDPTLETALAALDADDRTPATVAQRFELYAAAVDRAGAAGQIPPCLPDVVARDFNALFGFGDTTAPMRLISEAVFYKVHDGDQRRMLRSLGAPSPAHAHHTQAEFQAFGGINRLRGQQPL